MFVARLTRRFVSAKRLFNLEFVRKLVEHHAQSPVKRLSHGKLKLANSCWKTSKCWQTRAFIRQTRVKSQHTLNLQHGRRSAKALT